MSVVSGGGQSDQTKPTLKSILNPLSTVKVDNVLLKLEGNDLKIVLKSDARKTLKDRWNLFWESDKYDLDKKNRNGEYVIAEKLKAQVQGLAKETLETSSNIIKDNYTKLLEDLAERKKGRKWYDYLLFKSDKTIDDRKKEFKVRFNIENWVFKSAQSSSSSLSEVSRRSVSPPSSDAQLTAQATYSVSLKVLKPDSSSSKAQSPQTPSVVMPSKLNAEPNVSEEQQSGQVVPNKQNTPDEPVPVSTPTSGSDMTEKSSILPSTVSLKQDQVEGMSGSSSSSVAPTLPSVKISPSLVQQPPSTVVQHEAQKKEPPISTLQPTISSVISPSIPFSSQISPEITSNFQAARLLFEGGGEVVSDKSRSVKRSKTEDPVEIDLTLPKNLDQVRAQFGVAQKMYDEFAEEIALSRLSVTMKAIDELRELKGKIEKQMTIGDKQGEWHKKLDGFYKALDTAKLEHIKAHTKTKYESVFTQYQKNLADLRLVLEKQDFFKDGEEKISLIIAQYEKALKDFSIECDKQESDKSLPQSVAIMKEQHALLDQAFQTLNKKVGICVLQARQLIADERKAIQSSAEQLKADYRNTRYRPNISVPEIEESLPCDKMVATITNLQTAKEEIDGYLQIIDGIENEYNEFFVQLEKLEKLIERRLGGRWDDGHGIQNKNVGKVEQQFLEQILKLCKLTRLRYAKRLPEGVLVPQVPPKKIGGLKIDEQERLMCLLEVLQQDEDTLESQARGVLPGEETSKSLSELLSTSDAIEISHLPHNEQQRNKTHYDELERQKDNLNKLLGDIVAKVNSLIDEKLKQKHLQNLVKLCLEKYSGIEIQEDAVAHFQELYLENIKKILESKDLSLGDILTLEQNFQVTLNKIQSSVESCKGTFFELYDQAAEDELNGIIKRYGTLDQSGNVELDMKRYRTDLAKFISEQRQTSDESQ